MKESQRSAGWAANLVGALTAGRRRGDGLIRIGAFSAVTFALLRMLESNLEADRAARVVEQKQMIQAISQLTEGIKSLEQMTREHSAQQDTLGALILERYGNKR